MLAHYSGLKTYEKGSRWTVTIVNKPLRHATRLDGMFPLTALTELRKRITLYIQPFGFALIKCFQLILMSFENVQKHIHKGL